MAVRAHKREVGQSRPRSGLEGVQRDSVVALDEAVAVLAVLHSEVEATGLAVEPPLSASAFAFFLATSFWLRSRTRWTRVSTWPSGASAMPSSSASASAGVISSMFSRMASAACASRSGSEANCVQNGLIPAASSRHAHGLGDGVDGHEVGDLHANPDLVAKARVVRQLRLDRNGAQDVAQVCNLWSGRVASVAQVQVEREDQLVAKPGVLPGARHRATLSARAKGCFP